MARWINIDDKRNYHCGAYGDYDAYMIHSDVMCGKEETKGEQMLIIATRAIDHKKVYINPMQVCAVVPRYESDSTIVQFSGRDNDVEVLESVDSIAGMLTHEYNLMPKGGM